MALFLHPSGNIQYPKKNRDALISKPFLSKTKTILCGIFSTTAG